MNYNDDKYNKLRTEGQTDLFYFEQCKQLAQLVRELAGSSAARLMADRLNVSTQAINIRFPKGGKQS